MAISKSFKEELIHQFHFFSLPCIHTLAIMPTSRKYTLSPLNVGLGQPFDSNGPTEWCRSNRMSVLTLSFKKTHVLLLSSPAFVMTLKVHPWDTCLTFNWRFRRKHGKNISVAIALKQRHPANPQKHEQNWQPSHKKSREVVLYIMIMPIMNSYRGADQR